MPRFFFAALSLAEGLHLPMELPASEYGVGSGKRGNLKQATKSTIVTIERDPQAASIAMQHFARSPYAPYIRLVRGDATKALLSLQRAMRERRRDEENGEASRSIPPTEAQVLRREYFSNPGKEPTVIEQETAKCGQGEDTEENLVSVERLQHRTQETATNQAKQERIDKKDEEELEAKINGVEEDREEGQSKVTGSCNTAGAGGDDRVSCEDSRRPSLLSTHGHQAFSHLFQLEGQGHLPEPSLSSLALPSTGFDLIFLDADKRSYVQYLQLILHPAKPLLARDGLLIVDNVLFVASRKSGCLASTGGAMDQEKQVHEELVKLARQGSLGEEEALVVKTAGKQMKVQEEKREEGVQKRQSLERNETVEGTRNRSKRLLRIQEEMKRVRELLSSDERLVHVRTWLLWCVTAGACSAGYRSEILVFFIWFSPRVYGDPLDDSNRQMLLPMFSGPSMENTLTNPSNLHVWPTLSQLPQCGFDGGKSSVALEGGPRRDT